MTDPLLTDRPREPRPLLVAGALLTSRRVWLFVTAALFIGWLGWLSVAALTKSRGPVVSRAQAAGATHPVVARVTADPDGKPAAKVTVTRTLGKAPDGPAAGAEVEVPNLPEATGFDGPGDYLLLLARDRTSDAFYLAGPQRSPGYESLAGAGKPTVYRWSDDVPAQAEKLFP